VRIFPILFGEASNTEMATLAQLSGGRVFDGRRAALSLVFKDIRGYQ
jgi:Ca-activated chloride channel family protein